jgi:hypothetical protein
MIDWPCFFGPTVRKHIIVEVYVGAKLITSWQGSKRMKEENRTHNSRARLSKLNPSTRPQLLFKKKFFFETM